jgi:hypothetical protein
MLEERVKQLQNQVDKDFSYNESMKLDPFRRKEAAEKEAAGKEAVEKEVVEKVVAEEDDDDEEDQQALPRGSNNDDGCVSPIGFPKVKRC